MAKLKQKKYLHVEVNEHGVFAYFDTNAKYSPRILTKEELDEECMIAPSVTPRPGTDFAVVRPVNVAIEI